MKIEKVNDNQIRCTLSREDLAKRQIELSELAYGSDKARSLFKDMIQQANYEFGFDAEDLPLVVEAIPTSSESIVLVITKCEYPEELDTRFSRFSDPAPELLESMGGQKKAPAKGASDIVDLFKKAYEELAKGSDSEEKTDPAKAETKPDEKQEVPNELKDFTRLFELKSFDQAVRLSVVLSAFYEGDSALYKDPRTGFYYMTFHKGDNSPVQFNKVCNIAAEYGAQCNYTKSISAYFTEHDYCIVKEQAVQTLAQLA